MITREYSYLVELSVYYPKINWNAPYHIKVKKIGKQSVNEIIAMAVKNLRDAGEKSENVKIIDIEVLSTKWVWV